MGITRNRNSHTLPLLRMKVTGVTFEENQFDTQYVITSSMHKLSKAIITPKYQPIPLVITKREYQLLRPLTRETMAHSHREISTIAYPTAIITTALRVYLLIDNYNFTNKLRLRQTCIICSFNDFLNCQSIIRSKYSHGKHFQD